LSEERLTASAKQAEGAVSLWNNRVDDWTKGIQPAQQAEQRLMTIAQAFQAIKTGAWTTQGAALTAALASVGIHLDPNTVNNPAQVQLALHENILTTLPILKAATARPTQTEFVTTSENREHPNIQPEANLQMRRGHRPDAQSPNLPAASTPRWQSFAVRVGLSARNKLPRRLMPSKRAGAAQGYAWVTPPGSVSCRRGRAPREGHTTRRPRSLSFNDDEDNLPMSVANFPDDGRMMTWFG
jgi:hypothetical protein